MSHLSRSGAMRKRKIKMNDTQKVLAVRLGKRSYEPIMKTRKI